MEKTLLSLLSEIATAKEVLGLVHAVYELVRRPCSRQHRLRPLYKVPKQPNSGTTSEAGRDALSGSVLFLSSEAESKITIILRKVAVSLTNSLHFPSQISGDALTAKPRHRFRILNGPITIVMNSAASVLDSEEGVNANRFLVMSNKWQNRMEENKVSTLMTATKQQISLGAPILPNLQIGDFNAQIVFRIATIVAVKILLSKSFTELFTRCIFPTKREIGQRQFKQVAIYSGEIKHRDEPTIKKSEKDPDGNTRQNVENGKKRLVQVPHQIVLRGIVPHRVLVTKLSHGLLTILAKRLDVNGSLLEITDGVMDVATQKTFHIYVRSFSR